MVDVLPQDPDMLPSEYVALGWCQGAFARDAQGRSVSLSSDTAVSFCLSGAIRRWYTACGDDTLYHNYFTKVVARKSCAAMWNDAARRTQCDVVSFLEVVEHELWLCKVK